MKLPRFAPILTAFTARVAGRETAELLQSPAALARAVADTQTVVGHDGVLCLFDTLLLASACVRKQGDTACSSHLHHVALRDPAEVLHTPPVSTILESIQPLQLYLQGRALVFATFAGPGLLYSQLQETLRSCGGTNAVETDYVVDVIRSVVRSALELKADGIALIEPSAPANLQDLMRSYKTVRKLADFYDAAFLVFRLSAPEEPQAELPAHCVFDLKTMQNGPGLVTGSLGPGISSNVLPSTTAGDVPATTTVEELKALLHGLQCA